MDDIKRKLGEKIRTLRKSKGLTQEGLGEKADLSYKFIGEIERGRVNPSLETLSTIGKALDIKIADLFRENKDLLYQFSDKDIQTVKEALNLLNKALPK